MKALVACEFSGIVRDAFAARGHDAWSCDLLPTERPGQHIVGDVLEIIGHGWDLMIAHPPCTYLCGMGVWWNHKRPERWAKTYEAMAFVEELWAAPIALIAIENPIGYLNRNWMPPTQIVQPWQFGHEANKPTCLWLKGLPKLKPSQIVGKGKFYVKKNGARMSAWSHKCSGTRKEERARIASRTFEGIATAMAEQWNLPCLTQESKTRKRPGSPKPAARARVGKIICARTAVPMLEALVKACGYRVRVSEFPTRRKGKPARAALSREGR